MDGPLERVSLLQETAMVQWAVRFASCPERPIPLSAETYIDAYRSSSRAVGVACDDGRRYVIKPRDFEGGRVVCNDQIVGMLGRSLGAPVGQVAQVHVPDQLIRIESGLRHFSSGVTHGCLYVPNVSADREDVRHFTVPENRDRFARLAVLYSWVAAADKQLFYANHPPRLVYSFDHGHFFGRGTWDITSLAMMAPVAMDSYFDPCVFTQSELRGARQALENISEQQIANAVAMPPNEWGMTNTERMALAEFLSIRRIGLLTLL